MLLNGINVLSRLGELEGQIDKVAAHAGAGRNETATAFREYCDAEISRTAVASARQVAAVETRCNASIAGHAAALADELAAANQTITGLVSQLSTLNAIVSKLLPRVSAIRCGAVVPVSCDVDVTTVVSPAGGLVSLEVMWTKAANADDGTWATKELSDAAARAGKFTLADDAVIPGVEYAIKVRVTNQLGTGTISAVTKHTFIKNGCGSSEADVGAGCHQIYNDCPATRGSQVLMYHAITI